MPFSQCWVHFPREWPQWELSASPAPHQCHDQPKHCSLLVTDRKWLGLHSVVLQFHNTNGSHLYIGHAGHSCNPPPLQIAEKQLGLFSHWCIRFIGEGKLCVYESMCVCMHVMWLLHNDHPCFLSVSHSANLELFLSSCVHIQLTSKFKG